MKNIFLSEFGLDVNNGLSENSAIKSFDKLSDILKGINEEVTVNLNGDFYFDKPFILNNSNVSFTSLNGARLIGGKKLTGFNKDVFNGQNCYSITIENGVDFTDLYLDGKRVKLARYPLNTTLKAVSTEFGDKEFSWVYLDEHDKWFIANKTDVVSAGDISNAIVSFTHFWIDEHTPIESYDEVTGKITLKNATRFMISAFYPNENVESSSGDIHYYFENVKAGFVGENTWFYDKPNAKLYVIPPKNVNVNEVEVFIPTVENIITVTGSNANKIENVSFKNVTFICSKGDYVSKLVDVTEKMLTGDDGYASDAQSAHGSKGILQIYYANNVIIENCNFTCTGMCGVEMGFGVTNSKVLNSSFTEIGSNGIKIQGGENENEPNKRTYKITIKNNLIKNVSKRYDAGCGILIIHSAYNEVDNNEVCYTGYTGISCGWVWGYAHSESHHNVISNNYIHHIGVGNLSDMGGIYMLGVQTGTVIRGNVIHDVIGSHYGGWGIYTDQGSTNMLIENNTVYNCKSHCYHQNIGKNNIIKNNVFAFGGLGVTFYTFPEDHIGITYENNVFISNGKPIYDFHKLYDRKAINCVDSKNNVVYDTTLNEPILYIDDNGNAVNLDRWQKEFNKDINSIIKKPENINLKI